MAVTILDQLADYARLRVEKAKEKITMKKSIWIVLPIIIIAIVLVAVFAGQRNTLSTQIAQLEAGFSVCGNRRGI